jgi:hypothetical protein
MLVALVALGGFFIGLGPNAPAGERIAYALQWTALAALPLFLAIGSIGNARFSSEAIDPTLGKESRSMIINGRVVDNSVQQYLLFTAASLAIAAGARGDELGIVAAAAIIFVVARFAFWIGYRIRPVYRAAGFAATSYLSVVLFGYAIWLAWRP